MAYAAPTDQKPASNTDEAKTWRKWKRELELAERREKDWRTKAEKLLKQYRGAIPKQNSFNLLWANTETLAPALYNSLPRADVRRRFRDADPLGKVVADVAQRCLTFAGDCSSFDEDMRAAVLDALVQGRGVTRIRYVPSFQQVGVTEQTHAEAKELPAQGHEAQEGQSEELADEQVVSEQVDWLDFRRGYGRSWPEVPWIAFRHTLTKEDAAKQFGEEVANAIKYEETQEERDRQQSASKLGEEPSNDNSTAEFWEVWEKEKRKVCFYQAEYRDRMIYALDNPEGDPPIEFKHFWPIPKPLQFIDDTSTLIPVPPYEMYRAQADEVDRLSTRINKVINALKIRAVYDATLTEMSQLVGANDNEMIAVSQAQKWMANGGIEKAIWWMPVQQAAAVLTALYEARDRAKQAVYEISGIADVMRGATDPNETLGAQKLKANFSSGRLTKQQAEVARYARDLYRLMAEVIGEKFQPQTLQKMSGLKLPMQADKEQAQQMAMLAQQSQQPVPPEMQAILAKPAWEEVKAILGDDLSREYRIDVETDSTIAATLQEDMQAMRDTLTGVVELVQGLGPAVMQGALPVEALKSIMLAVCRRSKLGLDVEDAIEQIQQPPPPQQPEDNTAKVEEAKQQAETQREQMRLQAQGQLEQQKLAANERIEQEKMQSQERIAAHKAQMDERAKMAELVHKQRTESMAQESENVRMQMSLDQEQAGAERERAEADAKSVDVSDIKEAVSELMEAMTQAQELLMQMASKPKLRGLRKVRDAAGSVTHRIPVYDDDTEGEPLMVQ